MKIAICDDDGACLGRVQAIAEEYQKARPQHKLRFAAFSQPEVLLEAARHMGGYDIYILDVIMPGISGIELGLQLRRAGHQGKILYLTSSAEYSLDAFRVKAFDYLIKPITQEAFFRAMDEALAAAAEVKSKVLLVKTKESSVKLPYDSILYADFQKRAVCYHLTDGRELFSTSLRISFSQAMEALLEDRRFAACGQSMVVNLDHITEVESTAVVFGEGGRPFLGEKLCRKLRDVWAEYLFGQEV